MVDGSEKLFHVPWFFNLFNQLSKDNFETFFYKYEVWKNYFMKFASLVIFSLISVLNVQCMQKFH